MNCLKKQHSLATRRKIQTTIKATLANKRAIRDGHQREVKAASDLDAVGQSDGLKSQID